MSTDIDYRNRESIRVTLADNTDPSYRQQYQSLIKQRGVVGVVERFGRYLLIRRSARVVAPLFYALPGGGIEPGEPERDAIYREFTEELGVGGNPIRRLFESITPWGIHLHWWEVEMTDDEISRIKPSGNEVESVVWMTLDEINRNPNMLGSMGMFVQFCQEKNR